MVVDVQPSSGAWLGEPLPQAAGTREWFACVQAFSLSLESMASRSLLHDMGVQQPKIIQFTAWKGPSDHRAAANALRTLWRSPGFVDSRAKFGLLAANTNVNSGEEWEILKAGLSESRCVCCMLCCLATFLMLFDSRECIADMSAASFT